MKKTWMILLALLLCVSMLLCACEDELPIPATDEMTEVEDDNNSGGGKKPDSKPSGEENNAGSNSGASTPVKGEALEVDMYRLAYSDLGLAYTGYSEDDRIAMQVFYDFQMNYEKNLYCEYRYDELKRLVWFGAYGLENGYAKYEMYSAEIIYNGNEPTPASVKYYEFGVPADAGAKLEYHANGMISLLWLGADDDCDIFFSFDEKGRLLCCSYDQEWATYVLKYGVKYAENEYPEQMEICSSWDGTVESVTDLVYNEQGFLLEVLLDYDDGALKLELEYQDDGLWLTKYSILTFGKNETLIRQTVSEAELDAQGRIVERTQARYEGTTCAGKSVETFQYDENHRLIGKELNQYGETLALEYKVVYSWRYDDAGRVTKQDRDNYNAQGQLTSREIKEYEYNAMGKMTLERTTRYNADGTVSDMFGYRYTYDEQGNKIDTQPLEENSGSANVDRD